jgi:hypothetical protein
VRAAGAGVVGQSLEALGVEPVQPLVRGRPPDPDPLGDSVRALVRGEPQDDLGPHDQPGLLGPGPGQSLQLLSLFDLKDEYGESDLEEALVRHLETFPLELGDDFCFVGRQRRLRLDHQWFKVDLVFFHRRLRCLVVIDLKIGEFTHADAGQMNLYLNYAKEHWVRDGENPPVGLILCAEKGHDVARYALEGLGNKVLATTYRTTLPEEKVLLAEIERTRRALEQKPTPPAQAKRKRN